MKPEVSKSNVHGGIHGRLNENLCNAGGVEEDYVNRNFSEYSSTPLGVEKVSATYTPDVTGDI